MKRFIILAAALLGICTTAAATSPIDNPSAATEQQTAPFTHLSIDDVFEPLMDITLNEKNYSSIFENEFFAFLKKLHDKYDICVTCNLFYRTRGEATLDDVTTAFKEEFEANAHWLKFSWHGRNGYERYNSPELNKEAAESYVATNEAIRRFAGEEALTTFIRPSFFSGNKELWRMLSATEYGLDGIYCSDDGREADAGLTAEERDRMAADHSLTDDEGVHYVRSMVRFDGKRAEQGEEIVRNVLDRERPVEIYGIFMHQQSIIPYNADACAACENAIKILHSNNIPFAFPKRKTN